VSSKTTGTLMGDITRRQIDSLRSYNFGAKNLSKKKIGNNLILFWNNKQQTTIVVSFGLSLLLMYLIYLIRIC
jgi:hypothetical protein